MKRTLIASGILMMLGAPAHAADELTAIRDEIRQMKATYEARIQALEARLAQTESAAQQADAKAEQTARATPTPAQPATSRANAYNPEIALVLSGTYNYLQRDPDTYQLTGFIPSGGEVEPGPRNFSLGESELAISANIDPHFRGNLTVALTPENEAEAAIHLSKL